MLLMNKLKEKENYTKSELEIIDYIIKHPKQVTASTIDDLATLTYSSPPSIVRLCQKVGMKGFSDFKIKLATEISSFMINQDRIEVDIPIGPGSDSQSIAQTFLNLHYQALNDVLNTVDLKQVEAFANILYDADAITLLGTGESLIILEDFHYKTNKIGLTSICNALSGFDSFRKGKLKKEVILIVSHYANTIRVRNWIMEGKYAGVPVLLLCANKNSPILKLADQVILIDNEENRTRKMGSFASRTAFQYILDILYGILFSKNYEENVARLYDSSKRKKERDEFINLKSE